MKVEIARQVGSKIPKHSTEEGLGVALTAAERAITPLVVPNVRIVFNLDIQKSLGCVVTLCPLYLNPVSYNPLLEVPLREYLYY